MCVAMENLMNQNLNNFFFLSRESENHVEHFFVVESSKIRVTFHNLESFFTGHSTNFLFLLFLNNACIDDKDDRSLNNSCFICHFLCRPIEFQMRFEFPFQSFLLCLQFSPINRINFNFTINSFT